jgi:hypothetical protein
VRHWKALFLETQPCSNDQEKVFLVLPRRLTRDRRWRAGVYSSGGGHGGGGGGARTGGGPNHNSDGDGIGGQMRFRAEPA